MADEITFEFLNELRANQKHIFKLLSEQGKRADKIELTLERILGAFPDGDTEGHCRAHKAYIERAENTNRLVRECLETAIKLGGVAAIGWVFVALYYQFMADFLK